MIAKWSTTIMKPSWAKKRKKKSSKTKISTEELALSAEQQRWRHKVQNSSRRSQRLVTSATEKPEQLFSGPQTVSLTELANELEVAPERLKPLIDHNYLRIISGSTVVKPAPAAMSWLRGYFMPLTLRPILPTHMAAELVGCTESELRSLCLLYYIPLYSDPALGEYMSVVGFHTFFGAMHHFREPSRFDRQALLGLLMSSVPDGKRAPKNLTFNKRLDREIARIAKMKDPDRMERALALWESISDAKVLAADIAAAEQKEAPELPSIEKVERILVRSMGDAFTDETSE